ncbi:MAG: helix-turn-helix transcriptional regulator [Clostridiales bacterium]|jgi:transcriptional regulator with XRE-family HTH domain|nr:helix-turn-helix transcriptional regulator [Clostridiales bacterium]
MPFLPKRLQELRKLKGLTQKQLGEVIHISERSYRRYEGGEIDPYTSTTEQLADFLGVSVDYLLGRTDNPHSHLK